MERENRWERTTVKTVHKARHSIGMLPQPGCGRCSWLERLLSFGCHPDRCPRSCAEQIGLPLPLHTYVTAAAPPREAVHLEPSSSARILCPAALVRTPHPSSTLPRTSHPCFSPRTRRLDSSFDARHPSPPLLQPPPAWSYSTGAPTRGSRFGHNHPSPVPNPPP